MLRTRTLAQPIAQVHGAVRVSTSMDDVPLSRPTLSTDLIHHVFSDTGGMPISSRNVLHNAIDEDLAIQQPPELPLPAGFEYMQTVGHLLPRLSTKKHGSAILQHLSEASDTRDAEREFKLRRMDRDSRMYQLVLHQDASCALDPQDPPEPPVEPVQGEPRWERYRSMDEPYADEVAEESENADTTTATRAHVHTENDDEDEDEKSFARTAIDEDLALAGLNLGLHHGLQAGKQQIASATAAAAAAKSKGGRVTASNSGPATAAAADTASRGFPTFAFDYWANAMKATGRARHEFLPIEVELIEKGIKSVQRIYELMNGKPHYNAGPLRHPETGEWIARMSSPFTTSDEMSAQDASVIHTFTDFRLPGAHLPRLIMWMAPGDQLTDLSMGLPFLQVAPAVSKGSNGKRGMRQDVVFSIGRVSIYRLERKNWIDCLDSYNRKHYHAQRANMTRCGMSNCCVDFLVEYPRAMFIDRKPMKVGAMPNHEYTTELTQLMDEYSKHRAIESSTLSQSGIHTRRTIHLFDSLNMLLDDIRKWLEHGCAKYQARTEHRPVCFTPDTNTSASDVLSNCGRKSDLDNRHQFVVAFRASQLNISERACHALYDRYHSMVELIAAYEKCDPEERDNMLMHEVKFKDAAKYTLFGVAEDEETATEANAKLTGVKRKGGAAAGGKSGTPKEKAPFGAVTSARIHRFLYNLPAKETKTTKARANRA